MQKEVGKIGILAIQGAFIEHKNMFNKLGIDTVEIRKKKDLDDISGLVIPGGESTTMNLLLDNYELIDAIKELIKNELPVFGTCAGAILLSKNNSLGLMGIEIERNAYGSQLDSFEEDIDFNNKKFHAIYIRAPKIITTGKNVKILSKNKNNEIVLAKEGNILVSTFHPELTDDTIIHQYFLNMITQNL